jgi:hypothetical protein
MKRKVLRGEYSAYQALFLRRSKRYRSVVSVGRHRPIRQAETVSISNFGGLTDTKGLYQGKTGYRLRVSYD